MLVIGLISGTSADGVDAALLDIAVDRRRLSGLRWDCRGWLTRAYPPGLRQAVLRVASGAQTTARELCELDFAIAEEFAMAALDLCRECGVAQAAVQLLGSHGQTVWHQPALRPGADGGSTLQLGQPAVIAERTGIATVADFRPRDMAAGGQGAPLVPLVDYLLFRHSGQGRVLLNLGGIANITILPAGAQPADVWGFDTGPGNMLLDAVMTLISNGEQTYDSGGHVAAAGRVDQRLLDKLLEEPYYGQQPPKSTGRELFGPDYALRSLRQGRELGLDDSAIMVTLTELTALTVAAAIQRFLSPGGRFRQVIAAGGGAHNPTLVASLERRMGELGLAFVTTEAYGIPIDAKEAMAFAILAFLTAHGRTGNLPSVTGASRPVVLGTVSAGADGWPRPRPGRQRSSGANSACPASGRRHDA